MSHEPKLRPHPSSLSPYLKWGVRLGGTLLLLFFLWRLDLNLAKVLDDLRQANLGWIGLSIALVLPFIAIKAWRWQIILRDLGMPLAFGAAYRLYAVGLAAGSFTPGQAGDAIKAFYLREHGYPLGKALVSIVLDRLFDLAVLILLATSGLFFLGADFAGEWPVLALLLLGTLVGLLLLALPKTRNWLLNLALKFFVRRKAPDSTNADTNSVGGRSVVRLVPGSTLAQDKSLTESLVNLVPVFAITLLASLLALFRIWLLALALNINLSLTQVIAVSSLATVVSLVPVSIAGIGARDVVLVGILAKLGYAKEKAVSLSSLILLLNLVNLVVGYLIWFTRPKEKQ